MRCKAQDRNTLVVYHERFVETLKEKGDNSAELRAGARRTGRSCDEDEGEADGEGVTANGCGRSVGWLRGQRQM
eukprot:1294133-Rhodomonas_salina.3